MFRFNAMTMPIEISEGRISRLIRPQNVEREHWYLVVKCAGCSEPLYLFVDPGDGAIAQPIIGKGRISTSCPQCFHDAQYETSDVHRHRAESDIQFRHPTPKPTGRPRQPLSVRYPTVNPTFTAEWLEDRPEAAAGIGRCIALWTEVETELARLLATILGAYEEQSAAVFLTLRGSRAQADALNAAARVVLNPGDFELYEAIMSLKSSAEKERNALAHGQFGGAYAVTEGVLWIDPVDNIEHMINVRLDRGAVTQEHLDWVRSRTYVYEPGDIETIATSIGETRTLIGEFTGYMLAEDQAWRVARNAELSARPRVAQALSRLRAAKSAKENSET